MNKPRKWTPPRPHQGGAGPSGARTPPRRGQQPAQETTADYPPNHQAKDHPHPTGQGQPPSPQALKPGERLPKKYGPKNDKVFNHEQWQGLLQGFDKTWGARNIEWNWKGWFLVCILFPNIIELAWLRGCAWYGFGSSLLNWTNIHIYIYIMFIANLPHSLGCPYI